MPILELGNKVAWVRARIGMRYAIDLDMTQTTSKRVPKAGTSRTLWKTIREMSSGTVLLSGANKYENKAEAIEYASEIKADKFVERVWLVQEKTEVLAVEELT